SALSYYNIDRFDRASTKLEELLLSNNNAFYQEAKWYLSLSELKRGNKQKARDLFEQIITENGFYSKKAKEKMKAL
ncbi:MAG: tetratricopeptide repeat protein, partial [Bacteroidia bacterium]|nr:tetratricopeptide repeat protein [Bacteroidia bacterium]